MKLKKLKRPEVSIVVLNFNGREHLRKFLESVRQQSFKNFEVIVHDTLSTDGSLEMLKKEFPEVKVMHTDVNYGVSKSYNLGAEQAKGRYVATLANDLVLDKNWVKEMVNALKGDSNAAAAGCYINNKAGGYYKGEQCYGFYIDILGNPLTLHQPAPGYVFSSAGVMFKKDLVGKPYDDEYFFSGDEIYIGWKVLLMGYKTAQVNKAKLLHEGRASRRASGFVEFHGEKDKYINLLIFYGASTLLKLLPLITTNIAVTILLSIFRMRLPVRLKSYLWLITHIGLIASKRRELQRLRKAGEVEVLKYVCAKTPYGLGPLKRAADKFLLLYCWLLRIPVRELQKLQ